MPAYWPSGQLAGHNVKQDVRQCGPLVLPNSVSLILLTIQNAFQVQMMLIHIIFISIYAAIHILMPKMWMPIWMCLPLKTMQSRLPHPLLHECYNENLTEVTIPKIRKDRYREDYVFRPISL